MVGGYNYSNYSNPISIQSTYQNGSLIYYVLDDHKSIISLNSSFGFIKSVSYNAESIAISTTHVYIGSINTINKYDFDLNLVGSYPVGKIYQISTDSTNRIYAPYYVNYTGIKVFDENLNLIYNFVNSNGPLFGGYQINNGNYYFASNANKIGICRNYTVIGFISNLCTSFTQIRHFYNYYDEYILVSCYFNNKLMLYHYNGTFTGKYVSTAYSPTMSTLSEHEELIVSEALNNTYSVIEYIY